MDIKLKEVAPQVEITTEAKNQDSSAFQAGAKAQINPIGKSGTELQAGYFNEEYLQQLRGRKGAKTYDEMRRSEAQIAMLMSAIMGPIKAANWDFEAAPAGEVPDAEKHRELITYIAKEMIDWETHVHEALTMLVHGFSMFEVINNVVFNHPKFGTFNGLKGLAFRSQKTIEKWNIDKVTSELHSVDQWVQGDLAPSGSNYLTMLADFLLVFTLQKEGDNYEGISALRPMFGPWFRKNLYQKIAGIGVEKNAIGTPIGKVPKGIKQDDPQLVDFKDLLSNFTAHESSFLLIPEGWEIEVINNNFDPSKLKDLIVQENVEMVNAVVANFLALGMGGGSGSFALGTDLSDFFLSGIQGHANIIAGVWNRKLIPQLIKLNFGPQAGYPKLKVTGINDKAGKELADIIVALTGGKVIQADDKLEDFARKQYKLPVADPTTARKQDAPRLFAEKFASLQLAEGYKAQWKNDKDKIKAVMQEQLTAMLTNMTGRLKKEFDKATPAARIGLAMKIEPKVSDYRNALREVLAEVANRAYLSARKETPKARDVKLSEGAILLAAPRGGFFDSLPPGIKKIVKAQAELISSTQANDLTKIVSFQYGSTSAASEDVGVIIADIESAALPTIEGATGRGLSIEAAAGNAVSQVAAQARLEWFFEPEVLETIESFTFYNEDPISEICQELDGTTWATNDPDLDRYSPPLHHNCKSRLQPNERGADKNPEINRGGTAVTQKGLDSITLCEPSYGLDFQLVESK